MVLLIGGWVRHGDSLRSTRTEVLGGKFTKRDVLLGDLAVPVFASGARLGTIKLTLEAGQPVAYRHPCSALAPVCVVLHRVGAGAWAISSATESELLPEPVA